MARKRKKPEITDEDEIKKIASSLHKRNVKLKKLSLTDKQLALLKIIFNKETSIVFISGPAGTSKTYIAIYGALQLYNMNNDRGITYVRTIAESGEKSLGALPGEMAEKINPYMMPMNEKLDELLVPGQASILKEKGYCKRYACKLPSRRQLDGRNRNRGRISEFHIQGAYYFNDPTRSRQ